MNVIYLHGFNSSPYSIKGQQLKHYADERDDLVVHLPDLNMPPLDAVEKVAQLIQDLEQVALIGSSLGGFYATQLVAKYGVPAVLINPAMRPWQLFRTLFAEAQLPYQVTAQWSLDHAQLDQLEHMAVPSVQYADSLLVLLQQGDEVLDYREAELYYSAGQHQSLIMTEMHGNHAMENFADKIPMALQFLSDCIKLRKH